MNTQQVRQLHTSFPVFVEAFFPADKLLKATKTTMFEKFCLWFIKPKYQVDKIERHTLKYKIFRKKIYVLAHWINPPIHPGCRCQITSFEKR